MTLTRPRRSVPLLCALALMVSLFGPGLPAHADPIQSPHRLATWNMGISWDRWSQALQLAERRDVVALQEAPNDPPRDAQPTARQFTGGAEGPSNVEEFHLPSGQAGVADYWIYILHHPSRNLAMILRQPAREVIVSIDTVYRPVLGVVVEPTGTLFFSVHASSGHHTGQPGEAPSGAGGDAGSIVRRISDFAAGANHPQWAALGDWNLEPEQFNNPRIPSTTLPPGTRGYRPRQATQMTGLRELDYMVSNIVTDDWVTTANPGLGSDHLPVVFGSTRAAADNRPPPMIIESDRGVVLDVEAARHDPQSNVIGHVATEQPNQQWTFVQLPGLPGETTPVYQIVSQDSGMCLDINNSNSGPSRPGFQQTTSGVNVTVNTCHIQPFSGERKFVESQQFERIPVPPGWDQNAFYLVNLGSAFFVDVHDPAINNGTPFMGAPDDHRDSMVNQLPAQPGEIGQVFRLHTLPE